METSIRSIENLENNNQRTRVSENSSGSESSNLSAASHERCSLNWEIYRIISFPDSYSWHITSQLAKIGFYYFEEIVICHFCRHRVVITSETDGQHECSDRRRANVPLPTDSLDFRFETNRIISFLKAGWCKVVGNLPVGSLDLARWGFYYTGENDAARCTFCRLEVRGWEPGDNAYSEHLKWNPHCPFISGRQYINIKLGEEATQFELNHDCASIPRSIINGEKSSIEQTGVLQLTTCKHPVYASLSSRLTSYSTWPLSMTQRPNILSEAGFYYTGKGDRVICYQCGGGLKDWGHNDDPWVEHAVWFPRCAFLNLKKGSEFITMVQQLKTQQETNSARQSGIQANVTQTSNNEIENKATSTSEQTVPEFRRCTICLDKELGIVFLPCGHLAACVECAPQLSSCPLCRRKVTAYVRTFLP